EPLAFFLSLLTMNELGMIPVEEARDDRFRLRAPGAGAFKVDEAIEGQRVRLHRNREYWIEGIPHIDELNFRLDLSKASDVTEAFKRGELDIAHGIPLKMVGELQNDPRYAPYMLTTIQLHTSYFAYDCSTGPFSNADVRVALNTAINRRRLNENVYSNLGLIAHSLIPPGLLGFDESLRGHEYDPDRAKSLMQRAGYSGG